MERSQHAITHPVGEQFSLVTDTDLLEFLLRYRTIEPGALEAAIDGTSAGTMSPECSGDAGTGAPGSTVRVSAEITDQLARVEPARGS
ncbi:hypothetical protein HTZ84_01940 [Haloterrigena sp. SYSU A558-1]|uniref:Uncharacterized protein n=1 Tax=Haloterrigena gelatinilytica TaxID=2741724 RepID=A0A8J8GR50_9EURY|nr:hypothetical protein [Haloterrigena gelatinilytica]NUB93007.1 hypothetical protein [Haloterrigena gelatinilytica]NUC71083.1 hypothetical protein [Haloterrigena gelatinilytica]